MADLWFVILGITLVFFTVLEGWDYGAGALSFRVARSEAERRQIIAAIGPLWTWHEVWLLAAAGVLLVAFPIAMTAAFSGFYLALFMVVWCLLLRGIALEFGGHIKDRMWRGCWDRVFTYANILLAVLFGVAFGNVVRGVPLQGGAQEIPMALFTNFGVRGNVGILDWYTISIGGFSLVVLSAHGASYLVLKTSGPVRDRSASAAARLWGAAFVLLVITSVETLFVRPDFLDRAAARPALLLVVAVVGLGAWALREGARSGRDGLHFLGSATTLVGLLAGGFGLLYPDLLHSSVAPEHSLTVENSAAAPHGLAIALVWFPFALALSIAYFVVVLRGYRGKVGPPSVD